MNHVNLVLQAVTYFRNVGASPGAIRRLRAVSFRTRPANQSRPNPSK